jgi:hypothetical protein
MVDHRGRGLGAIGHRNLDEGVELRDDLLSNLSLVVASKVPLDVFERGEQLLDDRHRGFELSDLLIASPPERRQDAGAGGDHFARSRERVVVLGVQTLRVATPVWFILPSLPLIGHNQKTEEEKRDKTVGLSHLVERKYNKRLHARLPEPFR